MKFFKYILICIIFASYSYAYGQNQTATKNLEELEGVVEEDMNTSGAPGAVIAVLKDDEIIYEKAFGYANSLTKRRVEPGTVFQAASEAKLLTTLALLTVLEEKNIALNTQIGTIIPELSPQVSKITLHQLLSHTSGIMDSWAIKSDCKEDVLNYFTAAGDKILFEKPGAVFSYSNSGFTLAGLILSRLNDSSYEQAIQDLIFYPLDMTHSTFHPSEVVVWSFANGHILDSEQKKMMPAEFRLTAPTIRPAGGLFTNVHDMAKLATALMNKGTFNEKQVFSERIINIISSGINPLGIHPQYFGYPNSTYSYGTINFTYRGIKFFGHTGEAGNQNALYGIAPEHKTAIIVFSNAGWYPFIKSFEKAAEIFFPVKDERKEISFEKTDVENVVGKYFYSDVEDSKRDWIEILSRKDTLYVNFSASGEYRLKQIDNLKYQFSHPAFKFLPEIKFLKDEKGKIKYLNYLWRTNVKGE